MKRIIYLLAVLPLFFLWGCSGDDDGFQPNPIPEVGNQIKFEIGFAPQNDGKPQTRVATAPDFASTWENGDKIGLYIVKGTTGLQASSNWVDNLEMSYNGTSWTYTLPSGKEYYPNDDDKLSFYAYYPYLANVDPTAFAFAVKADQNGTEYNKSDLLMAKEANVAKSVNAVSLQFTHALSLVQVEFVSGGLGANIDALARVTMKAIATTKPFSLSATSIEASADAASDIVMTKVNGLANTYRALVPAQILSADKTLFAVTRGDRLVYTTSVATTLAQAKAAKYKITLTVPAIDPDHVYAVGDRYPYVGLTEGIVYWLKDPVAGKSKNGKIVSLDEGTSLTWNEWAGNADAKNLDNGIVNMKGIKNNPNGKPYEAYNWVHAKNKETEDYNDAAAKGIWYLPAKEELQALYVGYDTNGKDVFNGKLSATSGTKLSDNRYWSSSENNMNLAWIVSFIGGNTGDYVKDYFGRVRAVSAF